MYTKTNEFQFANEERKIELIKIDAFNLMRKYLIGIVDYQKTNDIILELSSHGLLEANELINYIKSNIYHEAYQCSIGQTKEMNIQLKARMLRFKNS